MINRNESNLIVESFIPDKKPTIQAVLEGPKTNIDPLTKASVRAFVDISDSTEQEFRVLPVQVWVNAKDVSVRENSIRPISVKVKIARRSNTIIPLPPAKPEK